jgi:acetolactate decarboxylase
LSEFEFLGALHVELLRRRELRREHPDHELFQTSTVQALLAGAFDGDVTLGEILEHGDLGLGTLNGLDGELIVVDGQAWKANLDATLSRPELSCKTPYAVVVSFSPGRPRALRGPFPASDLDRHLGGQIEAAQRPTAVRIDGHFESVRVRSVPKQKRPYPTLSDAIAEQRVSELADVSGTMVGFLFPDALNGIEMVGSHLHFVNEDRTRGGHVLSYALHEAIAYVDSVTRLRVELPPPIDVQPDGARVDQNELRRLEGAG